MASVPKIEQGQTLLLCDRWQTSAQAHTCYKKNVINKHKLCRGVVY